jgi:hypothetical protein
MSPRRHAVAALLLTAAALRLFHTTQADSHPPPATAPAAVDPEIVALLRRMSGDDWKDRQAATEELIKKGEKARPTVDAVLRGDSRAALQVDAETRTRLEGIRNRLFRRYDATGGSLTEATLVTLHLKDASIADALAAFEAAVGGRIYQYPEDFPGSSDGMKAAAQAAAAGAAAHRLVSLDLEAVPFWDAVPPFAAAIGRVPRRRYGALCLYPRTDTPDAQSLYDGPICIDGPFLISADRIRWDQAVVFAPLDVARIWPTAPKPSAAKPDRSAYFALTLSVVAEPKTAAFFNYERKITIDEAVDDRGNALTNPGEAVRPSLGSVGGNTWHVEITLNHPVRDAGTRIARLRGSFILPVLSKVDVWTIDDPFGRNQPATKTIEGKTLKLAPIPTPPGSPGAGQHLLRVALDNAPPGLPFDATSFTGRLLATIDSQLHVLDARGADLRREISTERAGNDVAFRIEVSPERSTDGKPASGGAAKLVWNIPVAVEERKVKFDFKDLPMP